MEWATFFLIVGSVAAGVSGAVLSTWGLRVKVYQQDLRLTELETRHVSGVRRDAAEKRWQKADIIEEAKKLAAAAQGRPQTRNPWDFF